MWNKTLWQMCRTTSADLQRHMSCSTRARAPDTASSDQTGTATLESLARTARQVALYGPNHPIPAQSLEQACRGLDRAAGGERLEVRAEEDGLIWDGTALPSRDPNVARFHAGMRDRLIASVEITPEVRTGDLARLLLVLASDAEEVAASGGALEVFGVSEGASIRINEVDFTGDVLVTEGIWRQLTAGVDPDEAGNLRRLIASCAHSLSAEDAEATETSSRVSSAEETEREDESAQEMVAAGIARIVQRAGEACYFTNKKEWEEWRDATARQLQGLSPRWRSAVFRAPAGVSSECPDMLSLLAAQMDESDCVSLVLDHPDSIRAERSDMLALALERILAEPTRRHSIEAVLHRRALEQGVPEAVYQNVVGLLVSRIEGKQSPEPQAASFHSQLGPVSSAPLRSEEDIGDLLRTTDPEAVRHSRLCMLQESLEAELTISQYGTVVSLLTKATEECAAKSDLDGLISVISLLGREAGVEAGREPSRRAVASSAVARASTERVVSALAEDLDAAPDDRAERTIDALGLLGELGMQALGHLVRAANESQAKLAMATLMARDGDEMSHLRDLVSQAGGITLERILGELVGCRDEDAAGRIATAASEASEEAWLKIIDLIVEGERRDLGRVLVPLLSYSSGTVKLAAVEAIAELGVEEAVADLCGMVERDATFGEGVRLREAAVRTLGSLGMGEAVPALCSVLEARAFLSKLGGHRPRMAAAEALAALGGPDSREALEQGCRSMHPGVRDACRRALARLMAVEGLTSGVSDGA